MSDMTILKKVSDAYKERVAARIRGDQQGVNQATNTIQMLERQVTERFRVISLHELGCLCEKCNY